MPDDKFFESDLYLLQQLFFPNARIVILLDPEGWVKPNFESGFVRIADQSGVRNLSYVHEGMVVINMTNIPVHRYPVQQGAVEGILSFNTKNEAFQSFTVDRFYFIRNDIETLRWVFPNNLKYPSFLYYYDQDAAYGNLFRGFCYLSGLFRQMAWLADGQFTVLHPSGLFFDLLPSGPYQSFSLFTKSFYDKGVALLQLISEQQVKAYAKLPTTDKGKASVKNEQGVLHQLSKCDFRYIRVPSAESESGFLKLSNVMHLRHREFPRWKKHHFRGMGEYTRAFAQVLSLEDFLKQEQVLEKLADLKTAIERETLPAGLGSSNVAELYHRLVEVLNNLPLDHSITLSLVHGDFTPENLSIEGDVLVMLDWEEARFSWPALGDVTDFIQFRMEEEGPPDLESFQDEWKKLINQEAFRVLVAEFAPESFLHFKVFWFMKALKYICDLKEEAYQPYFINWRIYFWRQLLAAYQEEQDWLTIPEPKARSTNL